MAARAAGGRSLSPGLSKGLYDDEDHEIYRSALTRDQDPADYAILMNRFKFLNLVQRVARMDVAEMVATVGLDALTFKGTPLPFVDDLPAAYAKGLTGTNRDTRRAGAMRQPQRQTDRFESGGGGNTHTTSYTRESAFVRQQRSEQAPENRWQRGRPRFVRTGEEADMFYGRLAQPRHRPQDVLRTAPFASEQYEYADNNNNNNNNNSSSRGNPANNRNSNYQTEQRDQPGARMEQSRGEVALPVVLRPGMYYRGKAGSHNLDGLVNPAQQTIPPLQAATNDSASPLGTWLPITSQGTDSNATQPFMDASPGSSGARVQQAQSYQNVGVGTEDEGLVSTPVANNQDPAFPTSGQPQAHDSVHATYHDRQQRVSFDSTAGGDPAATMGTNVSTPVTGSYGVPPIQNFEQLRRKGPIPRAKPGTVSPVMESAIEARQSLASSEPLSARSRARLAPRAKPPGVSMSRGDGNLPLEMVRHPVPLTPGGGQQVEDAVARSHSVALRPPHSPVILQRPTDRLAASTNVAPMYAPLQPDGDDDVGSTGSQDPSHLQQQQQQQQVSPPNSGYSSGQFSIPAVAYNEVHDTGADDEMRHLLQQLSQSVSQMLNDHVAIDAVARRDTRKDARGADDGKALRGYHTMFDEDERVASPPQQQQQRRYQGEVFGGRSSEVNPHDARLEELKQQDAALRDAVVAASTFDKASSAATAHVPPPSVGHASTSLVASPLHPTSVRRRRPQSRRGNMPDSAVQTLLSHKAATREYIAHNEQLWNTSHVSQLTFAARLQASLLNDLFDEVWGEVADILDEYIEGLADHELH